MYCHFACRSTDAEIEFDGANDTTTSSQIGEILRENQVLRSTVQCLADYLPEDVKSELLGVGCPALL